MKFVFIYSGLLISLCPPLLATPVRFLAWDHDVANRKISVKKGGEILEIPTLTPYKRTDPISLPNSGESLALITSDRVGNDGQPRSIELKFEEAIENPLVIIFSDTKAASGLRIYIIEDSTKNFPWGSVRFLNATSQEFVFKHDNRLIPINASWAPINLTTSGQSRNIEVQLYSKAMPRKVYYSSIWEHDPELRMLAIIVPGSQSATGKVNFKIIPENRRALLVTQAP